MASRMQASLDICRRYGRVLQAAWAERRSLEPVERSAEELAFLPAHLELTDTPVSPVPRWSMRIVMALFTLALVWACVGQLDIVAVAPGKTVTHSRTKVIQPLETAVVRKILVHDGQTVKKGDLLVELDALGVSADAHKAAQALVDARLADLRTTAVLAAIDTNSPPRLSQEATLPPTRLHAAQALAESEYATYLAKAQGLQAAIAQKQAELHTTEAAIEPLQRYAAIARDRVEDYKRLFDKHYVSRQDYLIRQQELINAERDVTLQRNHRTELVSALTAARKQLAATAADARQQWLDEQRQAREQIGQYATETQRAAQRDAMMQLRAPVDGTVQQMAIHTIGGVVTPAQALMAIVPVRDALEVEATILDKDIGFVRKGQPVVVKLESFPYTRYGYLTGTIVSVSHDAAQDEKLGLVFPARIKLDRDTLDIDGARVRITAGMGVSAEIKTGRRRVVDYLLSPLKAHVAESMRER